MYGRTLLRRKLHGSPATLEVIKTAHPVRHAIAHPPAVTVQIDIARVEASFVLGSNLWITVPPGK
jgi:hypothetical protein